MTPLSIYFKKDFSFLLIISTLLITFMKLNFLMRTNKDETLSSRPKRVLNSIFVDLEFCTSFIGDLELSISLIGDLELPTSLTGKGRAKWVELEKKVVVVVG